MSEQTSGQQGKPEDYYKQVSEELANGLYDQDLWQAALSEAGDDVNIATARYKLFRIRRLSGQEIPVSENEEEAEQGNFAGSPASQAFPSIPAVDDPPEQSKKSPVAHILTTVFYLLAILGLGYVNQALGLSIKISQEPVSTSQISSDEYNREVNNVRSEWSTLSKSKEFKRLSASEQKKLLRQYDERLHVLNRQISLFPSPQESQKMRERFDATTRSVISAYLCLIGILILTFKLSGHLKLGCLTTVILVVIPIIGWLGLLYIAIRNCQQAKQL